MTRLSKEIRTLLALLIFPLPVLCQAARNTVGVSGMVLSEGQNQRIQHAVVSLFNSVGNLIERVATPDSVPCLVEGICRPKGSKLGKEGFPFQGCLCFLTVKPHKRICHVNSEKVRVSVGLRGRLCWGPGL